MLPRSSATGYKKIKIVNKTGAGVAWPNVPLNPPLHICMRVFAMCLCIDIPLCVYKCVRVCVCVCVCARACVYACPKMGEFVCAYVYSAQSDTRLT